jgi:hydroxyacylglutathione hydrolase
MRFKRLYDDKLAQASYIIACEKTKSAIVIDPLRDVQRYLDAAQRENVRIDHVTETHIHADFLSGANDLALATGAQLHLSAMGGNDWQYNLADQTDINLLTDGLRFVVGTVRIEVVHTPGHTPEHLTFLVTDTTSAAEPIGALTGDFIFVGDVGRPDLLETAAGIAGTKETSARDLFRSLQRFKELPDYLQIWPGHGAGSACGKSLGAMPQSTLGYERLFNWALVEMDEEAFVRQVLDGQPDPPAYFAIMKRMNRDIPAPRKRISVPALSAEEIGERIREGAFVIDTRDKVSFATRHVEGTINLPWTKSFLSYGGQILPYDRDLFLIVSDPADVRAIANDLALIGIDRVAGAHALNPRASLDSTAMSSTAQMSTEYLAPRLQEVTVVDVRRDDEWEEGHIPGAIHIPLGAISKRFAEIPNDKPVVVHCQGGTRSAIAASILETNGIHAANIPGGFSEWVASGQSVEREGTAQR